MQNEKTCRNCHFLMKTYSSGNRGTLNWDRNERENGNIGEQFIRPHCYENPGDIWTTSPSGDFNEILDKKRKGCPYTPFCSDKTVPDAWAMHERSLKKKQFKRNTTIFWVTIATLIVSIIGVFIGLCV